MFLLDEFEKSGQHNKVPLDSDEYPGDYADAVIKQEAERIETEDTIRYMENLSDYDKKEIKNKTEQDQMIFADSLRDKMNQYMTEVPEQTDIGAPEEPEVPQPEQKKDPSILEKLQKAGGNPIATGLTLTKSLADSVAETQEGLGETTSGLPVAKIAKGVSNIAGAQLDFWNGMQKSVAKTIAAIPKAIEDGLDNINAAPDLLKGFNEKVSESIEHTYESSGEYKVNNIDVPHLAGELAGHFVVPGAAAKGAFAFAKAKSLGAIGTAATVLSTEAIVGGLITTKETGSIANFFWDKNEEARIPVLGLSLQMIHVDEDDTAFEARLKGALEGMIIPGGVYTVQGLYNGLKATKKLSGAIRDFAVVKHIDKRPSIVDDYMRSTTKADFDEVDFKKYIFRRYLSDSIDDAYQSSFFKFLRDDTGAYSPLGSILDPYPNKAEEVFGEITGQLKKSVGDSSVKLTKLSQQPKSSKLSKEIATTKKAVEEAKTASKEVEEFDTVLKKGIDDGDMSAAKKAYKKIEKNPHVKKAEQEKLNEVMSFLDENIDFFQGIKNRDLTLYNMMKSIVNNVNTKGIDPSEITSSNFLSILNNEASTFDDLARSVKDNNLAFKAQDEIYKKFFGFKTEKWSKERISKSIQDFVDTYGLDPIAFNKLNSDQQLSAVESVAIRRYVLEKGMTDFFEKGQKYAEFMASGGKHSKREAQIQTLAFAETYRGYEKLAREAAQASSEAGRILQLQRGDIKGQIFKKVMSKELDVKSFFSPQMNEKFMDKLLSAEPGEMKRMADEINKIYGAIKEGKLTQNQAFLAFSRHKTVKKALRNLSQMGYNNMLWGPTTLVKNVGGLIVNSAVDALETSMVKTFSPRSYYEAGGMNDETFRELVDVINRIDSEVETSLELMASSKRLSGLTNADGSIKTHKQILEESWSSGKSVVDPGSEKYGIGYEGWTDTERAIVKNHSQWFGKGNPSDELSRSYFNNHILEDSRKVKKSGFMDKFGDIHSYPLRALNATDDVAKARIVKSRMLLFSKQAVNKRIANMPEGKLATYKKNFYKNYTRDLKKEMDNMDHFTRAMDEGREVTLTKQYGKGAEQYSPLGIPVSGLVEVMQKWPVVKFFHPFARMSVNMADYMTQHVPLANIAHNKIRADWNAGGFRKAMVKAKTGTGIALSATGWMLARNNIITGAKPKDRAGREYWKQAGLQENSLNFGGFSIPLNLVDPFGRFLKLTADIHTSHNLHWNNEDEGALEATGQFLFESAASVGHMATPEVLAEFGVVMGKILNTEHTAIAQGVYEGSKKLSTVLSKAVPFSAAWRFIDQTGVFFEEGQKVQSSFEYDKDGVAKWDTMINTFKKNMPHFFGLPEKYLGFGGRLTSTVKNFLGDEIYYHNLPKDILGHVDQSAIDRIARIPDVLFKVKHKRTEPIYKKLKELGLHLPEEVYESKELAIPKLSRTLVLANERVTLNNEQYNELINYTVGVLPSGKRYMKHMKEYLNGLVQKDWFDKKPPLMQSLYIRNAISKYRKVGRKMFKRYNKQFREDIVNKRNKRMGIE